VALAYGIARQVYPRRRTMWFTVPVLVSFQPMFTFTTSVVNTDALLIVAFCALIYLSIRALKTRLSLGLALGIGAAFAAGLLTKPFILAMVVPLGVVLAWEGVRVLKRRQRVATTRTAQASVGRYLLSLGAMAVVVLALWGPWVVHAAQLGNSPFYANPIRTGQLEVAHPFYDYRLGRYLVDYGVSLLGGTWASLWGTLGWIDTPLDVPTYAVLYGVCALSIVGLGLYVARRARQRDRDEEAGLLGFLALCLLSLVGTLGAINYYSWRARGVGGGIQGRYYLGAIVPMSVLLATGLLSLLPRRLRPVGHWLLCWATVLLHAVVLFQVLLPRYYL
jgi:4-amino-4-deoxy-L-arabinose transferase-like glycosyltransferase